MNPTNMNDAALAERILPLIDLTLLGENDSADDIDALCDAATTEYGNVAAVCVWPTFVDQAVERLRGSSVQIAAVANFPEGDPDPHRAIVDAVSIVAKGGTEVDVVFPWRTLASGQDGVGTELVSQTRAAIGPDVALKVILETGELGDPELIRRAAFEALDGGADFLKTSTGKTEHSATPEAARVLLQALIDHDHAAGIKISGGVRSVDQALPYLDLADQMMGTYWTRPSTFRFGASSLLDDVLRVLAAQ